MPTIDVSLKDLQNLMHHKISLKNLEEEGILFVKGEIDGVEGDDLKVDCKETNRPDLWSTEGIARQILPQYTNEKGIPKYKIAKPKIEINVDSKIKKVRPYIVAAVAKNVKVTDNMIKQMIQLQEKVCLTFGRKRKEAAIGLYDFDKMTPPIRYAAVKPESIKFTPLGFKIEMTPGEILEDHPTGQEYAHLLEGSSLYPIVMDSADVVASFPPIINSETTGKVTEKTKNLFIEVTGTDLEKIQVALNVVVAALADRGASIEAVKINYPDTQIITPDFTPKSTSVKLDYINKISGLDVTAKKAQELLEKARYDVKISKDTLNVFYPSYRLDILHPIDVVEDIIISYGYNSIEPMIPSLATVGSLNEFGIFCNKVSNHMVGLGAIEVMNFTLTNKNILFDKMMMEDWGCVEIANPVSSQWSILRNWILPSLMEFFENNSSEEYPQQVYEVGDAVALDGEAETGTKDIKRLAWALAKKDATFTDAKQVLDYLLRGLGLKYSIENVKHPSFIKGRVGRVVVEGKKVAYIGELSPEVIVNFCVKMPVVAFELNLTDLYSIKNNL